MSVSLSGLVCDAVFVHSYGHLIAIPRCLQQWCFSFCHGFIHIFYLCVIVLSMWSGRVLKLLFFLFFSLSFFFGYDAGCQHGFVLETVE